MESSSRSADSGCSWLVDGQPCGATLAAESDPITLTGTAIVELQKVRCVVGHWYMETVNIIDEPQEFGWGGHMKRSAIPRDVTLRGSLDDGQG